MIHLQGKVAFVTGASRGIGAAVARALSNEGVSLGLASRSGDDLGLANALGLVCEREWKTARSIAEAAGNFSDDEQSRSQRSRKSRRLAAGHLDDDRLRVAAKVCVAIHAPIGEQDKRTIGHLGKQKHQKGLDCVQLADGRDE